MDIHTVVNRGFRAEVFKKEGKWAYEAWCPEGEFFDSLDGLYSREEAILCAGAAIGCQVELVNK